MAYNSSKHVRKEPRGGERSFGSNAWHTARKAKYARLVETLNFLSIDIVFSCWSKCSGCFHTRMVWLRVAKVLEVIDTYVLVHQV